MKSFVGYFFSGSTWFTSGSYFDNHVTWGDSVNVEIDTPGSQHWAEGVPPRYDVTTKFKTIAYVRGGMLTYYIHSGCTSSSSLNILLFNSSNIFSP